MIANESLRMRETSSTTTITTVTMITIDNRIKDKKPSELILPPLDMLETFPYVTRLSTAKTRPQESILRDELATLETTLEDIQLSSESSSI
ncbi:hypothetical protein Tco_0530494 [Tanacetum coccineum]